MPKTSPRFRSGRSPLTARLSVQLKANGRYTVTAVWIIALAVLGLFGSNAQALAAMAALWGGGVLWLGLNAGRRRPVAAGAIEPSRQAEPTTAAT